MRVAIIGSDIAGTATGYFLQKNGHHITFFERQGVAGLGYSYGNSGLLAPSICEPWNIADVVCQLFRNIGPNPPFFSVKPRQLFSFFSFGLSSIRYTKPDAFVQYFMRNIELARESIQLMDELTKVVPLSFNYNKGGSLRIFRKRDGDSEIKQSQRLLQHMMIPFETLAIEALIEKEPELRAISEDLKGALYLPEDKFGDAFRFTQGLTDHLETQGAEFKYGTHISLVPIQNRVLVREGNRLLDFDAVVLAAGFESVDLTRPLGITLPMKPIKGYAITADCTNPTHKPRLPIVDHARQIAITPLGNQVRVTGFAEFAGSDLTIKRSKTAYLKKCLQETYPNVSIAHPTLQPWVGLRPATVDGMPYISQTSYDNLFVNTGHGHLGWTLALGSGKLLADLVENPYEKRLNPFVLPIHTMRPR